MSNVVLNIRAEGRTLDEALASVNSRAEAAAADWRRANPEHSTFYVNAYDSEDHAFALGSRVFTSRDEAVRKGRNSSGVFLGAVEIKVNPSTLAVKQGSGAEYADARYFVVSRVDGNLKLSKGYATRAKANDAAGYGNAHRVIAITRRSSSFYA